MARRVDAAECLGYAAGMAEHVDADELLARLDEARRDGQALASDGDHTLWHGDVGEALFERALAEGALRGAAGAALAAEARGHGVEPHADPNETARRLLEAQRTGRYPDREAYAMMAWSFAGFREAEMGAYAERVLDRMGFDQAVRPFARRLLAFARDRGHSFWLVSASPLSIVQAAARRLGIDETRCVAMEPAVEAGTLLPRLASEPTYGEGKVRRLRGRTGAPLLAAFGDSLYDADLIEAAVVGVAVTPKPELLARLPTALVLEA